MSIRDELLLIKGSDPVLHVEKVHEWAQVNVESDLHRSLEWNDAKAAYAHRLDQIRNLIAVYVRYEDRPEVRQLVSLSTDRAQGGGYRDIDDILERRDLYTIMLTDALNDLQRLEAKYEMIKELKPIWSAAKKVKAKPAARPGKEEKRPEA
jgi:hypothetical protein